MKQYDDRGRLKCSFNGVSNEECERMFEGKHAALCDNCLGLCTYILEQDDPLPATGPETSCSFCERRATPATRMIMGCDVCICDLCVRHFTSEHVSTRATDAEK